MYIQLIYNNKSKIIFDSIKNVITTFSPCFAGDKLMKY